LIRDYLRDAPNLAKMPRPRLTSAEETAVEQVNSKDEYRVSGDPT
jgi:hypothetical protein